MKKIYFAIVAVVLVAMGGIVDAANCATNQVIAPEMVQSVSSVTVYWIKPMSSGSGWVKTRKSGKYDSDSNTLSVGGSTYKVEENPYYGSEDSSGRGAYRYVAGGNYYFNL